MKILLTDLGNAVAAQGGVERVLANMANEMQRRGHDVTVMIFDKRDGRLYFPLNEGVKFCNPGVGIHLNRVLVNLMNIFVRDKNKRQINSFLHSARIITQKIKPVVDNISPDIVIGFEAISAIVFSDSKIKHFPFIQMFHFNPETVLANPYLYRYYEAAECLQVLMPDDIFLTKKFLRHQNIVHIPNVVPQYRGCIDYATKTIISVGRIERVQKRQAILVKAFAKLADKYPEWNVEIWGDTDFDRQYFNELKNLLVDSCLENRIRFMGMSSCIEDQLIRASIFAFPSSYEGFPLALTEAMSVGLPVVACEECNAVNQIIHHGMNGILCKNGVDAFATGLDELMNDVSLREKLGHQGKNDMKEYSSDRIWSKWIELMEDVTRMFG